MVTTRLSPVHIRRASAPFVNFPTPPISHAHPAPRARVWQDDQFGNGWGTRHISDAAPFDLWSEYTHEFRFPSGEEKKWIRQTYGVQGIGHFGNFLVLETAVHPEPLPLTTVGFLPCLFPSGSRGSCCTTLSHLTITPTIQAPKSKTPSVLSGSRTGLTHRKHK